MTHSRIGRPRKHREWGEVAKLDADHCKRWGGFDGYHGPVTFDTGGVHSTLWEHDRESDRVSLFYAFTDGSSARDSFELYRQPSPIGGERVYIRAPCCGMLAVFVALMSQGVRCKRCASITTFGNRADPAKRAKRAAEKLAAQLGCSAWYAPPTQRPHGMTAAKFLRLAREHEASVQKAMKLLGPRIAAEKGSLRRYWRPCSFWRWRRGAGCRDAAAVSAPCRR